MPVYYDHPMSSQTPESPRISLETRLHDLFSEAARRAFGDEVEGFDPTVRPSKFADFQVNGALALAKRLGRPPRDVATALVDAVPSDQTLLESMEIAGPGFVNCKFTLQTLTNVTRELATDDNLGVDRVTTPHRYVVDYSSPNIAKNMHVGHLRTTVIGDAIVRLIMERGHEVVRQNHLGDWGTQFGMLIELLVESDDADAAAQALVHDLDSLYRAARAKFDSDEDFARRSRERVVLLQSGDTETLALWQKLVDTSKEYFRKVYEQLGVLLTDEDDRGESFYNDALDGVIEELESKDLVKLDDGAVCAYPPGFTGRDGEPFAMIVRKSDGGYGYAATDLATLRHSIERLGGDRLVYVTDARQAQHFYMVFAIGRQAGWVPDDVETIHVGYGMVLGDDGKPFKSRSGEVVQLGALLDEAIDRARSAMSERASDLSADEKERIAVAVGTGAVKWFDLKNEHTSNYVFDFDRMLAFNGNTGPYIQYASTRAKSVLRKAGVDIDAVSEPTIVEEQERALALHLPEFAAAVFRALDEYEPHHICSYLFELAERFTSFYENCPILSAESQEVRDSRLALCAITARLLDRGLDLLGIQALDRM